MTTTFEPKLDINLIDAHPKNVRHNASADPELVASIKASGLIQPIVVAPNPDAAGRYVLIAGHRRIDGSEQAGRKTVPAVVRTDLVTEGQQVEAMLIENGRRTDLSPIEEAEGYEQLTFFGYKQKDIATAVGHNARTVSERLKLLKLGKSTREKVHDREISIDDALALVSFADDPATTKKLEASIGSGNFKWTLESAVRDRTSRDRVAARADELRRASVPELTVPKNKGFWEWTNITDGPCQLYSTGTQDEADHDGCLAFTVTGPTNLQLLCTEPAKHRKAAAVDPAAAERTRAEEERRAAEGAERERQDIAKTLRVTAVLETLKPGLKLDPSFATLVRALLAGLVADWEYGLDEYFRALGIPEDAQFHPWQETDQRAAHFREIDDMSDFRLARALAGLLLGTAEGQVDTVAHSEERRPHVMRYLGLLDRIGHDFSDVDREIQTAARGDVDEISNEDEGVDQ